MSVSYSGLRDFQNDTRFCIGNNHPWPLASAHISAVSAAVTPYLRNRFEMQTLTIIIFSITIILHIT